MSDSALERLVEEWGLVRPTGGEPEARGGVSPRPRTLAGASGALCDNSKDNAADLLAQLAGMLSDEFGTSGANTYTKPLHTRVAPASLLEDAAREDFALVAIGD